MRVNAGPDFVIGAWCCAIMHCGKKVRNWKLGDEKQNAAQTPAWSATVYLDGMVPFEELDELP